MADDQIKTANPHCLDACIDPLWCIQRNICKSDAVMPKSQTTSGWQVDAGFIRKTYPHKVAPECSCEIASTCQHRPCCYYGEIVPKNVRSILVPPDTIWPTDLEIAGDRLASGFMRCLQADNKCAVTGRACHDKCGCREELKEWCKQ